VIGEGDERKGWMVETKKQEKPKIASGNMVWEDRTKIQMKFMKEAEALHGSTYCLDLVSLCETHGTKLYTSP
jgi:hypothetical protein